MQTEFRVQLNTIDRVKRFVKICDNYEEDIDLSSGRYIIDAKSIMGIFSFDLTKPLNIRIHSNNIDVVRRFNEEMSEYRYDD
ncbi:MAG: HPr family phosphocarrier protein [Bacteroidaceae bacterium]|nr:HPr family phosphocarrier protein [Bacteroidaceae bacterium]